MIRNGLHASKFGVALAAVMTVSSAATTPTITRIDTMGYTGLKGYVNTPYLKPGVPKEYWIYGNRVNDAKRVTLAGTPVGVLERGSNMLKVFLLVPPGTSRGMKALKLTFDPLSCPFYIPNPFTSPPNCPDFHLTRDVMVLRAGTVSSVSPNVGITPNQQVTLTFSGSNLQNATIIQKISMFKAVSVAERNSGSLKVKATTSTCGVAVAIIGDEAEGGEMYPYGTLNVRTTATCPYQPPPNVLGGSPCPPGQYWDVAAQSCKY